MTDEVTTEAQTTDPFKGMADMMVNAAQAVKEGSLDARAKVEQTLPRVNRFVARLVYTTSYTLSYGVVFPTVFVTRSIPRENPIVHGLVDGAHAAFDALDEMRKRKQDAAAPEVQA
jgi:hypothetical protein